MSGSAANNSIFYASDVRQIYHFSSSALHEYLSNEFNKTTSLSKGYFHALKLLNSDDARYNRYELYKEIPKISQKLSIICKSIISEILKHRDVEIVDYSCTQGLAAVIAIENLITNGFDISRLNRITIVDHSQTRLDNAIIHLNALCPNLQVRCVRSSYFDILPSDLDISSMYCIHIFGDIIEKYQYVPYSFAATLKNTRQLFDCYIFYKDVRANQNERKMYVANNCKNLFFNKLFTWSQKLTSCLQPERFASEYNADNKDEDWAYIVYANHSLSNLYITDSDYDTQGMYIDELYTKHTTALRVLYYRDDLLPQTKPYDKSDWWRALKEQDIVLITENFLIYRISELYKEDPEVFDSIVERYKTLIENGCYEAYNNLGVIKIMTEYKCEDDGSDEYIIDEAKKFFVIAANHGSTSAMRNLLSYACSKKDEDEANYYINKLIEHNDSFGYCERATSLLLGVHEPQNIEQAKAYYTQLINSVPDREGEGPRGGERNIAIFNLARMAYDHASPDDLVKALRSLETCNDTLDPLETLKAATLSRLGLKQQAYETLLELEKRYEDKFLPYNIAYNIALCYMHGIGCKIDYEKAESYFKKSLDTISDDTPCFPKGHRGIGNLYVKLGRIEEARHHYEIAIKFDSDYYCAARANLAIINNEDTYDVASELLNSHSGCKSCGEANNYDAEKRLCPKCQCWLVKKSDLADTSKSYIVQSRLYEAANQGYPKAQYLLGKSKINSDKKEAQKWLNLAAKQGDAEAQSMLYELEKFNSDLGSVSNQAIKWLALSAKKNADAQLMMFWEYELGDLPEDEKESYQWLVKAASNNSATAQFLLGTKLYDTNHIDMGLKLIVQAASNGDSDATSWIEQKNRESIELRKKIAKLVYAEIKHTKITKEEQEQHGLQKESGLIYSADNKRLLFHFGCGNTEVHIKEGTIYICDDCFNDMYSESEGFYINTYYLPKSLRHIGQNAFTTYVKSIISESQHFVVENSTLFTNDKKVLIRYFGNNSKCVIPEGVEKLEGGSLWAEGIKEIILPESLTIVNGNPFYINNTNDFPIISSNSPIIKVVEGMVIDILDKKLIAYQKSNEIIHIPEGIEELSRDSFFGSIVKDIYLPKSIRKIDESAFYWCFNLKYIHVPYGSKAHFQQLLPEYMFKYKHVELIEDFNNNDDIQIESSYTKRKNEAEEIIKYLTDNQIDCFYHFTDRSNIESIRNSGGLYSWSYCANNDIKITVPGGSSESRSLDMRYNLEDYVRLSFCKDHPMAFRLKTEGANLVLLKIKIDVAMLRETLFSDINATDKNHHHGGRLEDLKKVDLNATKQTFVSKDSPIFKSHQAEILVKTHIPLEYIINLDNPISL